MSGQEPAEQHQGQGADPGTIPQPGPAPQQPVPEGTPFRYTGLFHLILFSDLIICMIAGPILFTTAKAGAGRFSEMQTLLVTGFLALIIANAFLDVRFFALEKSSPDTIDRMLCGIKAVAGILAIFTVISGIYFLVLSMVLYREKRKGTVQVHQETA